MTNKDSKINAANLNEDLSRSSTLNQDSLREQLEKLFGGDLELMQRILSKIVAQIPDTLKELDNAFENNHEENIKQLSHTLAGTVSYIQPEETVIFLNDLEKNFCLADKSIWQDKFQDLKLEINDNLVKIENIIHSANS